MTHCFASERCVDRSRDEPALAEDGPLCEGCLLAGERAVPALVLDYRDLEQVLPKSVSVWSDGQPAGSGEAPVLFRLDVEELQREIWWVLTAWEEVLRDRERLADTHRRTRDGAAVQRAAGIIGPRVRILAAVEPCGFWCYPPSRGWSEVSGAMGLLHLVDLHRRAQRQLGLTRALPERCEGVPCRECDLLALYREPGEDTVRCGNEECGYRYQADEYRRWVGLLAESVRSRGAA